MKVPPTLKKTRIVDNQSIANLEFADSSVPIAYYSYG